VFDDSFYHEAHNKSDKPRIVLIIDVWHPDFTDEEVNRDLLFAICRLLM
jgi:aspartyl/asparaginyl beta-hydroxylase (cupin superfamily)